MSKNFESELKHLAMGLSPIADAFSGTVYTDVVNMENYGKCRFIIHGGAGATGTSTFTVEACDDAVPTTVSAIPFYYREYTGDVPGALTAAAAAGFTCAARAPRLIDIEVAAEALAASGYSYVRLKAVEVANDPVLGGVDIELSEPRASANVDATALT